MIVKGKNTSETYSATSYILFSSKTTPQLINWLNNFNRLINQLNFLTD